jgi:ADP-heptose:LPS heptosyltransferase
VTEGKPVLAVFEQHHLGDALLSLPFLRGAAETHRVIVVCRPSVAALFRELGLPGEIRECPVPWTDRTGWMAWMRAMRRIAAEDRPVAAVSVWPDPRVHAGMRLSGARRRVSFRVSPRNVYGAARPWIRRGMILGKAADRALRLLGLGGFLTEPLDKESSDQPHWAGWRQMAGALSVPWRAELPWIDAAADPLPEASRAWVEEARRAGRRVVLVHPGARHPARRWDGFARVAREGLSPRGDAVLWVDDGETPAEVPHGEAHVARAAGFRELAALIRASDLVLANDSFPAHLAAALGKKVVTVFTSQKPSWFAPYGSGHRVAQRDVCPYRPCIDHCVMPRFICRDAVTAGDVLEKIAAEG